MSWRAVVLKTKLFKEKAKNFLSNITRTFPIGIFSCRARVHTLTFLCSFSRQKDLTSEFDIYGLRVASRQFTMIRVLRIDFVFFSTRLFPCPRRKKHQFLFCSVSMYAKLSKIYNKSRYIRSWKRKNLRSRVSYLWRDRSIEEKRRTSVSITRRLHLFSFSHQRRRPLIKHSKTRSLHRLW